MPHPPPCKGGARPSVLLPGAWCLVGLVWLVELVALVALAWLVELVVWSGCLTGLV